MNESLGFNLSVSTMETLQQNVSKDHLTITLRNTHPKSPENERENSLPIPVDLIIEIFSRLSRSSIARCRCVSKHWACILRRPDFTELFFSMSLARPQLLFACLEDSKLVLYSSPQPQNPNENSSPLFASYHMSFPLDMYYNVDICNHVNGLILLKHLRKEKGGIVLVICNPSTGQCLSLPKLASRVWVMSYFGYDPIEKQYKVLSVTWSKGSKEYQVLTLGIGEPSWRIIKCCRPHIYHPLHKGVCINGVLYYICTITGVLKDSMIVCFDFKSEKFRFIEEDMGTFKKGYGTLINYNGKLATLGSKTSSFISRTSESFELWVLEDIDKQEWSKHTCVLPALGQNVIGDANLHFVGVTQTNEIVLASSFSVPFDLFYYNMEKKTMIRLQIQGMEDFPLNYIFLNHIEDVKLL